MKDMNNSPENRESRIVIDSWLARRGVTRAKIEAFGRAIGLSANQTRIKYKDPGRLTVTEIRRMRLTDSDVIRLVKGIRE